MFPADFYAELQRRLPPAELFTPIDETRNTRGYPDRAILELTPAGLAQAPEPYRGFWSDIGRWMLSGRLARVMLDKFGDVLRERFRGHSRMEFYEDAVLVHDRTNYVLGPHTDSPQKVVSALFYLPPDDSLELHGTSLYAPREPGFTCPGGPHYRFELFERVRTMPFLPNTLFAFPKTHACFHGVEAIKDAQVHRYALQYNIRIRDMAKFNAARTAPG